MRWHLWKSCYWKSGRPKWIHWNWDAILQRHQWVQSTWGSIWFMAVHWAGSMLQFFTLNSDMLGIGLRIPLTLVPLFNRNIHWWARSDHRISKTLLADRKIGRLIWLQVESLQSHFRRFAHFIEEQESWIMKNRQESTCKYTGGGRKVPWRGAKRS